MEDINELKKIKKEIERKTMDLKKLQSQMFFEDKHKRTIHIEIVTIYEETILNIEDFAIEYLMSKFPDAEIVKNFARGETSGIPDLLVNLQGKKYYVEVKSAHDDIRRSQMEWILNNPGKKVKFLMFRQFSKGLKPRKTKKILKTPNKYPKEYLSNKKRSWV